MSQPMTKRVPVFLLMFCVAAAPAVAGGHPTAQPQKQVDQSRAGKMTKGRFVLPVPDSIRPRTVVPRLQSSYCGDLAGDVGGGAASIGAQIIALIAVLGWCAGTVAGADEMIRGDLEQGLIITTAATALGALVGWGVGFGLARNNQVPENQVPLWELGGATIGAGSSLVVGVSALGIRMLLNPPALQEPVKKDDERRRRRRRPRPRSR